MRINHVDLPVGTKVMAYRWPPEIEFTVVGHETIDGWPYCLVRHDNGDQWRMPRLHLCTHPLHQRKRPR